MKSQTLSLAMGMVLLGWTVAGAMAPILPTNDHRYTEPKTLNTLRRFPAIKSRAEWTDRARELRTQVLVSAGLWPMPAKAPLKAHIFSKTEHGDFSIEKVYLQTWPGFFLAGNLYRPLGKGPGPFPGVLNPHGHWSKGRLEDGKDGSIPARCISFARLGMVAFSYDMVGYNDTQFGGGPGTPGYKTHRFFGTNATDQLWHISLMGLQTWNSLRALDFLESLPDIDKTRLACTGASGGGTQTFILGAIDDRLAALAPTVMVSHSMQGGCSCENMPGLRIDFSNMEIAAVPAPRPQIFMAATGDWTKLTMTVEGPAVESIYTLFGAPKKLRYEVLNFGHNYNQTTREAVYAWFARWLLQYPELTSLKEPPYPPATNLDLRVFPDNQFPPEALGQNELIQQLVAQARAQLDALKPADKKSLARFKDLMLPAYRHTLQVEFPQKTVLAEAGPTEPTGDFSSTRLALGRKDRGDRVPALLLAPKRASRALVVLVNPAGKEGYLDQQGAPVGLARTLLERRQAVLLVDPFLTGQMANETLAAKRNFQANFFTTYNRTDCQERVQDLLTACAYGRGKYRRVILCGEGQAGLWALLAAPAADAVAADVQALAVADDHALLARDLFVPGLRRLGAFSGVATLAAPHPLLLHNTGAGFDTQWLRDVYAAINAAKVLRVEAQPLAQPSLADWLEKAAP